MYMRGKYRDEQQKVYDFFKSRPELQTPVEISKDEHRELCMRQLLSMVREGGIRPFKYVVEEPGRYFAIAEAAGILDVSFGVKLGVQYRYHIIYLKKIKRTEILIYRFDLVLFFGSAFSDS